jgi:hypothetical protein
MPWVDITNYSPSESGAAVKKLLARAILESGVVRLEGEKETVGALAVVPDPVLGRSFVPADGQAYLGALSRNFRSHAMMASALQVGTPPPAKFVDP